MSAGYQPTWLRLSEARTRLMSSSSLSESEAGAWLLRAIQDQLRVDVEGYAAQTMFRVQGFPTPWKRRRFPRDWPARLTSDRVDWEASTINGPDPFRLIDNNLFIEVSASAVTSALTDSEAPPIESPDPPRRLTKQSVGEWVRSYISSTQNPSIEGIDARARADGIIGGRELYRKEYKTQMAEMGIATTQGRRRN